MTGRWLVIFLILAVGWGMLELMLRQMKIGDHAQSPQHFEIPQGATVLVGGGRAGVSFLEAPFLRSAIFQIRCKDTEQVVRLKPGTVSDELCDVRVRLVELVPGGRVAIEVTWGPNPPLQSEPSSQTSTPPTTTPNGAPETHD